MMRKLMITLVASTCFAATVAAQQKVEIAGSQVQKIQSSIVNQEYVTGHSGNKAEGYACGIQYVFERPSRKLSNEALSKFTRKYKTDKGNMIEIKNEGNGLVVNFDNANKDILYAASDTDFYSKNELLTISFKTDNSKVTGFELKRYGGVC